MKIAKVFDGVIVNVVVIPDDADPARYGGVELPKGKWIGDRVLDEEPQPTQLDIIEAQVTYTAMMTDTLLEV